MQTVTKPRPLRTVVADDYDPARGLLVDALTATGRFSIVAEAVDGLGALDAVTSHRPDLALLDLGMPGAGGLDVIEELNVASPDTRLVVVSGFPGRRLEELVVARGAAAYVRKRISIRAVIDDILAAAGVLEVAELVLAETRRFGRDHRAPREARRFVSDLLERWECREALDTVHLLLSEVVANAVVHAGSAPEVSVRLLADAVRVEVGDDDPTVPEPAAPAAMGTSGRGLRILDSLARRWGANLRPGGGKVVWFDVPRFDSPPAVSLGPTAHPAPRP